MTAETAVELSPETLREALIGARTSLALLALTLNPSPRRAPELGDAATRALGEELREKLTSTPPMRGQISALDHVAHLGVRAASTRMAMYLGIVCGDELDADTSAPDDNNVGWRIADDGLQLEFGSDFRPARRHDLTRFLLRHHRNAAGNCPYLAELMGTLPNELLFVIDRTFARERLGHGQGSHRAIVSPASVNWKAGLRANEIARYLTENLRGMLSDDSLRPEALCPPVDYPASDPVLGTALAEVLDHELARLDALIETLGRTSLIDDLMLLMLSTGDHVLAEVDAIVGGAFFGPPSIEALEDHVMRVGTPEILKDMAGARWLYARTLAPQIQRRVYAVRN